MMHSLKICVAAWLAAVVMGMPCMAQDVQPPFTWQGKGTGSFISEYGGTEEVDFDFEMSIDEQGMVKGKTTSDDGTSRIVHCFYSEKKYYEVPGLFSRNIVIVLMINEYGDTPMLGVLNARALADVFLYGEVLLARYESGSDTAKALGVGDSQATLMDGDELPSGLKSALKKCLPVGMAKIEGDYKQAEASAAGGQ
ncbi:MAG: hypothetical protein JSW27_25010 [Phycisphaerales bacterium]|nr:MAG: hypothetical protein JSW27_25010 [Phycisphaerales bacterium]